MSRIALTLPLLAALLLSAGCCTVDHEQQARTARQRIDALERIADPAHPDAIPDEDLTPGAFRRVAAQEVKSWKVVEARSLGLDELPEGAR